MVEQSGVTTLQVLEEAREYVANSWTKGAYYRTTAETRKVIGRTDHYLIKRVAENKKHVKKAIDDKNFRMCSVGGVRMARVIINGITSQSALQQDPAYQNAMFQLGQVVEDDEQRVWERYNQAPTPYPRRRQIISHLPLAEARVIAFNDSPGRTREEVVELFDKAISAERATVKV